jgi:hypothetical protein
LDFREVHGGDSDSDSDVQKALQNCTDTPQDADTSETLALPKVLTALPKVLTFMGSVSTWGSVSALGSVNLKNVKIAEKSLKL